MQKIKKTEINYPFLTRPLILIERECGHNIVLAHKDGEMVNVSTWIKTGSINENDEITGISHFVEHVMFKGTKNHAAGEFDKFLEAKGAIVNAATWKDYTFYYVTLPKGENCENLYETIELHADMMLNPIFPDEELGLPFELNDTNVKQKRERHVVIEEINMRNDQPWSKIYNMMNKNMYKNHPYKRDVIGTPEVISSVTRETINNYYNKYYSPNNMTTIIVGDFDEDTVCEKVVKAFDFQGRKCTQTTHYKLDTPHENVVYEKSSANINTSFLIIGFLCPCAADLKGTILADILNIILGEGQSSRLYQNLIEKAEEPIFNLLLSDYYSFKDGGTFLIEANFNPNKEDKAIELIKNEIQKIIDCGIKENEFLKAKKKLEARFAENTETVSDIADHIGHYVTVCNGLTLVNGYLDTLSQITIENVLQAAKNYLSFNKATIAVLEPNMPN